MSTPPLPSATFLALVPGKDNPLTKDRLREITACLESGHWKLDPSEVDPRSGHNLVRAIVEEYVQDDEVRMMALSLAVKFGADVNFKDTKGFTPWDAARAMEDRDIQEHLESLGAKVPMGKMNAKQEGLVRPLRTLSVSFEIGARLVERILEEGAFESLDEEVNEVPLGLQMIWGRMNVNGAEIARGDSIAETLSMTDRVMVGLSSMGKKALELEPGSLFPLWCWLAQAQSVYWAGQDASDSRRQKWEGSWRSLERKILRTRYPKEGRAAAEASLASDLTGMVERSMHKAAAGKHSDQDKKMLQPLAGTLMTGLLSWKNRRDGMSDQDLKHRRQAAWDAAARLPRSVPQERWNKEFASTWASPMYYALQGREVSRAIDGGGPLPSWVPSPWVTLLPLVESRYKYAKTQEDRAKIVESMAALPATKEEVELGMNMIAHCPQLQTSLRE